MTRKPQDTKLHPEAESAAAVASARTKQELDSAEAKRRAQADPAADSPSGRIHPKVHRSEEEEPIQDTSGEPNVEDEP